MRYFRIFGIIFLMLAASVGLSNLYISPVHADTPCSAADRNQGLVSGLGLTGTFGNPTGQCVFSQKAAYVNFKVPNYDELKSVFFTQNKTSTSVTIGASSTTGYPSCPNGMVSGSIYLQSLPFSSKTIVNVQCQFTHIADSDATWGPFAVAGTQQTVVVFVDSHLYIDSDINYGGDSYGLVLVAKGDIYIAPTVKKINAILVNEGNVYTSGINSTIAPNSQQLVVNGSLVNLSQTASRIYFNRSLTDNNVPAEVVNYQPKFLVLLRGLMTQSYTIQREIGADEIPSASIFPSPTGIPSPAPTQNPGSTFQNAYCVFGVYNLFNTLNIASDTDIPCS